MKRLNCTVGDKRGYKGDCMEISSSGRYVEFDAAMRANEHAEMCANASAKRQISTLEQQRDELLKAIDRVTNGTLLDSAGNRDEDGMISPWADASSIGHWIKILSEAAGKAKGDAGATVIRNELAC